MSGVMAVWKLLTASAALTAIVPKARIKAGELPLKTEVPAIGITTISEVDRHTVAQGATRHVTERVQVTIMGETYPQVKQIKRIVKNAGDAKMPVVTGISEVTVRADGAGPDFTDEDVKIPMQMQDFLVSYNEATGV
jgi:hypothetical protein